MKSVQIVRLRRQSGLGMISVFVILAVSIFIGLFAFKVGPHYLENWTVVKIVDDMSSDPNILKQPRSKVYQYLNQAYRTNSLWDLNAEDTVTLTRNGKDGFSAVVNYEKRAKLFHNIDVVTSFNYTPQVAAAE